MTVVLVVYIDCMCMCIMHNIRYLCTGIYLIDVYGIFT